MPKFIAKLKDKVGEKKLMVKGMTAANAKMFIDSSFSFVFFGIDGFAGGKPSRLQRYVWKHYVIPAIKKGTMDEEMKAALERCNRILDCAKQGMTIPVSDRAWIKDTLKPKFEEDLKRTSGKTVAMLGFIDEKDVSRKIKEFKKQEKNIYH